MAPFSGEIVYRQTAVPDAASSEARDLGELHYFIDGANWKHVDGHGDTIVLYEPSPNLVHYFKPQRKTVDASHAEQPAKFEHLDEVKIVLGHDYKAIRQTSGDVTFTVYYDPEVFVDPALYEKHKLGHWGELLAQTNGALTLASTTAMPGGTIIGEAISIVPKTLDAQTWVIPAGEVESEAVKP